MTVAAGPDRPALDQQQRAPKRALVAGHVCLDVIPGLEPVPGGVAAYVQPGRLLRAGPAVLSPGGPVANTGLALYRLGIPVRLAALVGRDPFGDVLRGMFASVAPDLAGGVLAAPDVATSYSIVVSPPGVDRCFWHHSGANDAFCADDVDPDLLERADLLHFGYPTVMRRMYADGGRELVELFRRAKEHGLTTSLDLSYPDASDVDWRAVLIATLPYVDVFEPSIDEWLFLTDRPRFERMSASDVFERPLSRSLLDELASSALGAGAAVVALKLGAQGLYVRTASSSRLHRAGRGFPSELDAWADRSVFRPCFRVEVAGTTGAGDATIAGFLAAMLRDLPPDEAAVMAVAVGACNVEAKDALSGVRSWKETLARVSAGWETLTC